MESNNKIHPAINSFNQMQIIRKLSNTFPFLNIQIFQFFSFLNSYFLISITPFIQLFNLDWGNHLILVNLL